MKFEIDLTHYKTIDGKKKVWASRTEWLTIEDIEEIIQEKYKDYFGEDEECKAIIRQEEK